jgi:hypothetical protein
VEREVVGVDRRGALLGPEESGRESLVTRFLDRFFWVTKPPRLPIFADRGEMVGWLGPAFTRCWWRVVAGGVGFPSFAVSRRRWLVGVAGVPARILRTA